MEKGDIIQHSDQLHIVSGTGSSRGAGIELFDPVELKTTEHLSGSTTEIQQQGNLVRRSLGFETVLDDDEDTQALLITSYRVTDGTYLAEWGDAPLGSLAVSLCARNRLTCSSVTDLSQLLFSMLQTPETTSIYQDLGVNPQHIDTLLSSVRQQVSEYGEQRVQTISGEVPESVFVATSPPIPTIDSEQLQAETEQLLAGDRWITLPAPSTESVPVENRSLQTFAEGTCHVYLGPTQNRPDLSSAGHTESTIYEITTDTELDASPSDIEGLDEQSRDQGVFLKLLGRDCHVDAINGVTVSLHVYRAETSEREFFMLSGAREQTTEPRLEHPLSLSTTVAPHIDDVSSLLAGEGTSISHPLSIWMDGNTQLQEIADHLSSRIQNHHIHR